MFVSNKKYDFCFNAKYFSIDTHDFKLDFRFSKKRLKPSYCSIIKRNVVLKYDLENITGKICKYERNKT